jgi:hypothetical protein
LYLEHGFVAVLAVSAILIAEQIEEFRTSMGTNPTLSASLRSRLECRTVSFGWARPAKAVTP